MLRFIVFVACWETVCIYNLVTNCLWDWMHCILVIIYRQGVWGLYLISLFQISDTTLTWYQSHSNKIQNPNPTIFSNKKMIVHRLHRVHLRTKTQPNRRHRRFLFHPAAAIADVAAYTIVFVQRLHHRARRPSSPLLFDLKENDDKGRLALDPESRDLHLSLCRRLHVVAIHIFVPSSRRLCRLTFIFVFFSASYSSSTRPLQSALTWANRADLSHRAEPTLSWLEPSRRP